MAIDLTFGSQGGGGSGAGSGDYVKDTFLDVSLPATNNTSLTSSASTNPNTQFFGNTDAPKYSSKTLWVKGLKLIEDRTKWLSNKPTYEIVWHENMPGVYGYVCGDARQLSFAVSDGACILIRNPADFMGITGNIRNVLWLVNPSLLSTATAMRVTDGSDTSTIDFSGLATDAVGRGINHYAGFVHSASNATDDLHDYRLKAVQNDTLNIAGVVVYFENSTNNLKIFPGTTYVDKSKVITSGITTMSLPTGDTTMGFASVVYKNTNGSYGVTTQNVVPLVTGAAGASGTNILTVTTGTGVSYMSGMGVVVQSGASYHLTQLVTVSTDVFTMGSTLPYTTSGATLWRSWYAGSTLAISATLFSKKFELDPIYASNPVEPSSFGASASGNYLYSEPNGAYRAFGQLQLTTAFNGIPVLAPLGATTGFLQIDGNFQAAEVEWVGLGSSSVLHGTFSINGLPAWGQNQGFTSIQKQTIFTDGQNGWNSLVFTSGSSFLNCGIAKINLYQLAAPIGPTLGRLMEYSDHAGFVPRAAYNATVMSLGINTRHFADQFFLQGQWTRSATTSAAGGVRYIGASTNSVFNYQYYGQNFNILGTAGTSAILTVDGASTAVAFNTIKSVATLGFHSIQFTCQSGTHLIEAIDIFKPKMGIRSVQNFTPLVQLANIATTYVQSDTPRNVKNGDIWAETPLTSYALPRIWVRLFGYWLQLNTSTVADDPHFDELFQAGGVTDSSTTVTATAFKYNGLAWSTTVSMPAALAYASKSSAQYISKFYFSGGTPNTASSGFTVTSNYGFNKSSWVTETVTPTTRQSTTSYNAFGFLYYNKGTSNGDAGNVSPAAYKYNGSAWSTPTAWATGHFNPTNGFLSNLLSCILGGDSGGTPTTAHETRNASDAISSATVAPAASSGSPSSNVNSTLIMSAMVGAGTTSNSYTWNGSAWSSALTAPYSTAEQAAGAFSSARNLFYAIGGNVGSSVPTTNNFQFNGVSFTSNAAMPATRRFSTAACI